MREELLQGMVVSRLVFDAAGFQVGDARFRVTFHGRCSQSNQTLPFLADSG